MKSSLNSSDSNSESSYVVSNSFSDFEWIVAVSIFAIGGMIGSLPAGIVADLIGRKWALLGNSITAVVAVCLQSCAIHPIMLIVGRFIMGINAGLYFLWY